MRITNLMLGVMLVVVMGGCGDGCNKGSNSSTSLSDKNETSAIKKIAMDSVNNIQPNIEKIDQVKMDDQKCFNAIKAYLLDPRYTSEKRYGVENNKIFCLMVGNIVENIRTEYSMNDGLGFAIKNPKTNPDVLYKLGKNVESNIKIMDPVAQDSESHLTYPNPLNDGHPLNIKGKQFYTSRHKETDLCDTNMLRIIYTN